MSRREAKTRLDVREIKQRMGEKLQYVEIQILLLSPSLMSTRSVTDRGAGSVNIDGKRKILRKVFGGREKKKKNRTETSAWKSYESNIKRDF